MANSAHIGALAVMDPDRYPLSTTQRQRMVEARAAVAELIEAANRSLAHVERRAALGAITAPEIQDLTAFRAALSRVTGGA